MSTIAKASQPATSSSIKRLIVRHPLVAYFVIAFAGSWAFLLPIALSRNVYGLGILPFRVPDIVFILAFVLGTPAGPALASLSVTAVTSGKAGLRLLLRRCVQWRVGIGWYLIAIFGFIPIWLINLSLFHGINSPLALLLNWTLILTMFFPKAVMTILTASFAEELGWRGFALPRLQQRYGPVLGTIILGSLHGLWHLPAFFTLANGPFILTSFVGFLVVAIATTFFYTWVFNHTKGSVLIATLTHGFGDAAVFVAVLIPAHLVVTGWASPFVNGGWQADNIVIFSALAVLLLLFTRGRLGYQSKQNAQLFEVARPLEMPSNVEVESPGRS
jgi:uncharacterized protein